MSSPNSDKFKRTEEQLAELRALHPRAVKMPLERMLEGERVQLKSLSGLNDWLDSKLPQAHPYPISFSDLQIDLLLGLEEAELDQVILDMSEEYLSP